MWVSTSLSRVFTKKEEILIGRKSFGVMWESWPAFGINITLTSSHLDGMWLIASQPWKMAVSQGREEPVRELQGRHLRLSTPAKFVKNNSARSGTKFEVCLDISSTITT